jgi:hypothetical protein
MKDQLPSYQDALNVSPSNPNELLLIRLQVWHFFDVGRSPILNRQFARSFRQSNLAHWTVREVHVTEPNDMASRDTFVPVQVIAVLLVPVHARQEKSGLVRNC